MPKLFAFGLGYVAKPFAAALLAEGWHVTGTTRHEDKAAALRNEGIDPVLWSAGDPLPDHSLNDVDAILISLAPNAEGCPVAQALEKCPQKSGVKIIYLSSSGVYGDHDGAWVDEDTVCQPETERGIRRLKAENDWRTLSDKWGANLTLCRLAGIYGPGRNAIESLQGKTRGAKAGLAQRVIKPGQVFNRIHRDDIVAGLLAILEAENVPTVINFSDDEPAPPQDVITYAAELLGIDPPPEIAFEDADLSPMGRSFYHDNKRLKNERLTTLVDGRLLFPTFRTGLLRTSTKQS